jgi:hypothetical protein
VGEQFELSGSVSPAETPVLVVDDHGSTVRIRLEGRPARRYGPGLGRKPRAVRALSALLLLVLPACGGDGDAATACERSDRSGTYLMQFSERSGDCGPIPEQLGRLDDAEALLDGCALDAPDRWTEGDCKLERAYTCAEDGIEQGASSSWVAVTTQADDSGSRIIGTVTVRISDAGGAQLCRGTYEFSASRQ